LQVWVGGSTFAVVAQQIQPEKGALQYPMVDPGIMVSTYIIFVPFVIYNE